MALTPDEIDGLRELILAVYGPVTEELLRDLCRCITAAGQISSGDEYKLLLAKSLAGADDVIADTLRRQTDLTDDAVEQLMRWAAEKTAPLEENESLRNIAEAYVKVTRKEVANVLGQLAEKIDAVLDGGPCSLGVESTILDLTCLPYRILRQGGLSRDRLESVLEPGRLENS